MLSEDVADCPRLKVLRLEENCIEKAMITPKILKHSQIALLAIDGNLFPSKDFPHLEGYEEVRCTTNLLVVRQWLLYFFTTKCITSIC